MLSHLMMFSTMIAISKSTAGAEVIWFQTMRSSIVDTSNWTVIPVNTVGYPQNISDPNQTINGIINGCPSGKDQCWALCGDEMYRIAPTKGYKNIALTFSIDPYAMTKEGEYCELSYSIDNSDTVWNTFNTSTAMEHVVDRILYLDEETWDNHGVGIKVKVVKSNGGCCYISDFYFTGIPITTTSNPTTGNPTTDRPTANPTTGNPTTGNPTTGNPTTDRPTANPITGNPTTNKLTFKPTTIAPITPTINPINPRDTITSNMDNEVRETTNGIISDMDADISKDNNDNIDKQTMIHIIVGTGGGIILLSCLSCLVCMATICYFDKKDSNIPPLKTMVSTESRMSVNDVCSVTSVTTPPNDGHRDTQTITLDLNVSSTPMGSDTDSNDEDDEDIMYKKGNGKTAKGPPPKLSIDGNIDDEELYTVHTTNCGEIGGDVDKHSNEM